MELDYRIVDAVRGEGRFARVYLGAKRGEFFSVPPGEVTGPPGSLRDFLLEKGESDGTHMTHGASEALGAETVLAGSDFPHPEALARPMEFAEHLEGLPAANTAELLGI